MPNALTSLSSRQGVALLIASKPNSDYGKLTRYFVTQKNRAFCGVASLVMVLNAMGVPRPLTQEYYPDDLFTQNNLFNDAVLNYITPGKIAASGLTLHQLAVIARLYPINVSLFYADNTHNTLASFRQRAKKLSEQPSNTLL